MTKKKYSKSSSFYLETKMDFFTKNDELLKNDQKHKIIYNSQPKRSKCKICEEVLPRSVDFHSHNIDYVFCSECNHLNGTFEDTKSFVKQIYMTDDGSEYAKNYLDENFYKRTTDVYIPKVDFLISSLPPKKYEILDIGCGSGYFVLASLLRDISVSGIDLSKTMVEFGNNQIANQTKKKPLRYVSEISFIEEIVNSSADIISAIGVLEHLREPHKFFEAFQQSKAQYLYYSVPMFSLSAVLENVNDSVFPRQLSVSHTHLFTESSIIKLNELIGVKSLYEWRFGTDSMDLYRHILIQLQANNVSQKTIDYFYEGLGAKIDEIQSTFDTNHFCSEIHVVAIKY